MKIYFLSSQPCELTLNGAFFGITDCFERFAEVALSDNVFAKFTPQDALPIGFFINEELLASPPLGCEVYLLKEGVAVFAKEFPPADFTLTTIAQERFGQSLLTVFRQGALQLSLQTPQGFFLSTLPPSFAPCTLSTHADLFFIEGENCLAVYTNRGECVFLEQILAFRVRENALDATLPLSDSLGRIAEGSFELSEDGCRRTRFALKQARSLDGGADEKKIKEELLAYAFFESVLLGADYEEFLSEELALKARDLKAFLGEFKGVSLTKKPNVVGLIREKTPRLFQVDEYAITIEQGKIVDIKG